MTKSATRIQDKDTQKRLSVVQSTEDPTKYWVVILNPDGSKIRWPQWEPWEAATIEVGNTTTWNPWTSASVTNSGTTSAAVLNFTIPRWDKGETGTISVGTTTTGEAWTSASVTNSWTSTDAVFNFTIPKGDKGETWDDATVSVWTTTTGQPWTNASVTNSWTSWAAVFNFTIPQWLQGEQWNTGNGIQSVTSSKNWKITTVTVNYTDGSTPYQFQISDWADGEGSGDVLWPNSSTDWHFALFDGTSGKLIKNWWAIVDVLNSSSTTDALSANQGKELNTSISTINGKIPSAATTTNQLADKNYVDTSINSVAAYYITKNAAGDQFATHAELTAATTFYSGWVARTPTRNDYCIVADDEDHDHSTTRYIYNNTWEFQYVVNETALTSDQLAALNSGITSGKVSTYDGYATTIAWKQDALTAGSNISITTSWGTTTIAATDTTYSDATQSTAWLMSASDKTKLDGIEAQAQKNTITGVKGDAESTYRTGNVNITPANIGITNKAAASGWTADTLVTTGDKYNWSNKQDALSTQTAYTSKGTASKVPTITTNTLGQVTGITETSITFPVTSVWGSTGAVWLKTINWNSIVGTGNITVSSSTTITVTLTSAGWSSNSQTVSATWVTASNTVIVSPAPSDIADYADCGVYCSAQGSGTLTFGCDTAPSGDIVVNVLIMS